MATQSERAPNPYATPNVMGQDTSPPMAVTPALPIELAGEVTVDDYLTAWRLASWTTASLWIRYAGRCVFAITGAIFLLAAWGSYISERWSDAKWQLLLGLMMFGCLVWVFVAIQRNVQRHLVAMDNRLGDAPLVCDADGVHIKGDVVAMDYKWEGFEGYRANDTTLILYITYPRMYLGLFAAHADSPEHWKTLCTLVEDKLEPR